MSNNKRAPRLKLDLLGKFAILSFFTLAAMGLVMGWKIQGHVETRALENEAEHEASWAHNFLAKNLLATDFEKIPDLQRYEEIDRLIRKNLLSSHVVRIKIWNTERYIIYSDKKELVGRRFPLEGELKEALEGKMAIKYSKLNRAENVYERGLYNRLMEIYVPFRVDGSSKIVGVFEIYHDLTNLASHLASMKRFIWSWIGLGLSILFGSLFWIVRNASRELVRRHNENARLYEEVKEQLAERKQAEALLQKTEAEFKELYDQAPVGYFEYDTGGGITRVNHAGTGMFGYTREEMIGQPAWKFMADEESAQHSIAGKFAGKIKPARNTETTARRKDGTLFPVLLEDRVLLNEEGQVMSIRAVVEDITERKRLEEEKNELEKKFRQSQKMEAIGKLAGGVAHDFNNLLTVIGGYSEFSLRELQGDSPIRENLEEIRKASQRASELTRQLLAFSRRQVLEMEVLELNSTLNEMDKLLRRLIGEDIELKTVFTENPGKVMTDRGQIEQVVLNLAVNARDAMPSGGKLTIETANVELDEEYTQTQVDLKPGSYVLLSVSDTGVGIKPEVKEHIFEPFFTTKEKGRGTGLGLSTVYGIVKQSGGTISVYSELGVGTTFKVYLPRVEKPLGVEAEKTVSIERFSGEETILVVEDEQEVRELAVRILKNYGYQIIEASSGEEALRICDEGNGPVHLMVTDVVMPGMNGRELANRLAPLFPSMKTLFSSGYTGEAVFHHGVLENGTHYIQKPFTVDGLAKKVREVLDN